MKIIDLLNKIANGEEVPKKIKYRGIIWYLEQDFSNRLPYYKNGYNTNNLLTGREKDYFSHSLNDEVEILEEEKEIPEKLDMVLLGQCDNWTQKYNKDTKEMENTHIELNPYVIDTIRENTLEIQHKFNDIIDYLKSKGE